jgi:hypothetical protein
MKKLNLLTSEDPAQNKNSSMLMTYFKSSAFTPDHLSARFSVPASSAQRGFYQRMGGVVYVCIELCPDTANPLGGGATVSFTSGDVITAPLPCVNPQIYATGDWLGLNSFTLTQLSNGTKYTNCRVQSNSGTGIAEIVIFHNIGATASTFMLEGFYIVKA